MRVSQKTCELPGVGKEAKKVKKIIEVSNVFIGGR